MRYRVEHITKVTYKSAASLAHFNLRIAPVAWPGQKVSDFEVTIDPEPATRSLREAPYPFHLARMEIDQPFKELEIRATFLAEVAEPQLDLVTPDPSIRAVAKAAIMAGEIDPWAPAHYIFPSQLLPGLTDIAEWAAPHLKPDMPACASGLALAQAIKRDFKYEPGATEADTPVDQAFEMKRGVCQDFAHVLIEAFRSVGLPAAYVSGYLRTIPPPGKPRLIGVDAMHAWVALWCGAQRGWVGIDPTNGCLAGSGHVVTGMGRDYADVAPIDGIFVGGGEQKIDAAVDVVPLED